MNGFSIFDTSGIVLLQPFINCRQWIAKETEAKRIAVRRFANLLPPCPCSGFQAMLSPLHVWLPNTDCFVTVTKHFNNTPSNFMGMVSTYLLVGRSIGLSVCRSVCLSVCRSVGLSVAIKIYNDFYMIQ